MADRRARERHEGGEETEGRWKPGGGRKKGGEKGGKTEARGKRVGEGPDNRHWPGREFAQGSHWAGKRHAARHGRVPAVNSPAGKDGGPAEWALHITPSQLIIYSIQDQNGFSQVTLKTPRSKMLTSFSICVCLV